MTKYIAGNFEDSDLRIGDVVIDKDGKELTGKGRVIILDYKYANYEGECVEVFQHNQYTNKTSKIKFSKQEIQLLLNNF